MTGPTITPSLEVLKDRPVSDDGFMDWLTQWNQLDIDVWDAYTQGESTLEDLTAVRAKITNDLET